LHEIVGVMFVEHVVIEGAGLAGGGEEMFPLFYVGRFMFHHLREAIKVCY